MREKEEAKRLRRLSAVVRFVAQMGETAGNRGVADARQGERELIESLVQAMAVWHDLDARGYRRGLDGLYELTVSLPGAAVSGDPQTMDVGDIVSPDAGCQLASLTDLEQLGWHGQQGEMLLLPVSAGGTIRWILAIPGGVDREVESLLLLVCRTAGGVIEQMDAARGREVESRLRRRMTLGRASFQARTRGLVEEMAQLTGAAAARLSVRAGGRRALTLAAVGDEWATSAVPVLDAGASRVEPARMTFGLALGNEAVGIMELAAMTGQRFGVDEASIAPCALSVVGAWLAGVSCTAGKAAGGDGPAAAPPPPFEREIQTELERARRLSLDGGVLVATVPGGVSDPGVVSTVIQVVRSELRSADLLGQLASGDIAAVLVRTSRDGVATAAVRVRQRLDALARERRLPAVVVGHALYPGAGGDSPAALVARARREAGLMFSN